MHRTCLFCAADLGTNQAVLAFPVGRRLAFDPSKGRLWVVCQRCERWNLSPLDERWEAVEQCESHFRMAKQRVCTENIGLARLDEGLELVRIGPALRPEFAAWRYGDQFGRRRRRAMGNGAAIAAAASAAAVGALGLGAVALGGLVVYRLGSRYVKRVRDEQLVARVRTSEGETLSVLRRHLAGARLSPQIAGGVGWRLDLPHLGGSKTLRGEHALTALSLIMPTINGTGGSLRRVRLAIKRLEQFDDPTHYLLSASAASDLRPGGALPALPADMRLAIEMAANEESERFALEGEMWLLAEAWREAEEIAAIADDLVVPDDIKRRLEELHVATDVENRRR